MKTKKLVSLFLAVAMIFSVFTLSISASSVYDWEEYVYGDLDTYSPLCAGAGFLGFIDSTRRLTAWTQVINTTHETQTYRVQVQCCIQYAGSEYNFDSNLITVIVEPELEPPEEDGISLGSAKAEVYLIGDSSQTIVSLSGEYHIGDMSYNSLWEGFISKDYYLGINS